MQTDDGRLMTKKIDGGIASYYDSFAIREAVFNKIIDWFLKHKIDCGKSIIHGLFMEDKCDRPTIEAPHLLAEILDDIVEFDISFDEDDDSL